MSAALDEYLSGAAALVHEDFEVRANLTRANIVPRLTHLADGGDRASPREAALAAFCLALLRADGICEGRPVCVTDPCSRYCNSGGVALELWRRALDFAGIVR